MQPTKEMLLESRIIFNHVPKAGGTSLIALFNEIFGPDRCWRHRARNAATGLYTPAINKMPTEELETYRFLAGHFDYGNHARFTTPSLYIGVMRDPYERVISDYFFNKSQGREDLMEQTNRMSLEEYILEKMALEKSRLVTSAQPLYLSGQPSAEEAIAIIEAHYLAVCTNEQLDEMQRMLARIYDRPDLAPVKTNITLAEKLDTEISAATRAKLDERFEEDYKLLSWVHRAFETKYRLQLL